MKNEHDNDRDEIQMQAMLRSLDSNAPPPDAGMLERLRLQAAEAFDGAGNDRSEVDRAGTNQLVQTSEIAEVAGGNESPTTDGGSVVSQIPGRRISMFALVARVSLLASAAAVLLAAWLIPMGPEAVVGASPFSRVLQELRGASTLHLQLVKGDQQSEILVRAPGLVRKEESPQRYQIAAGSRLWKVDESENTVVEGDSPWFLSPDQPINLLGLLEVGVKDGEPLLNARPFARTVYEGRDCFAYRVELPGDHGRIRIEAFAEAKNQQLVGIIARDAAVAGDAGPRLAELRLLAMNQAVADDKFAVAKSLTEDGRIGKVSDAQGIVVLRPMLAKRWTPICRETLLRPGDWLRTELRGANAVKVVLSSDVILTLGPGTLLECISPTQARLHSGQVQVQRSPSAKAAANAEKEGDKPLPNGGDIKFTLLAPRVGQRLFPNGVKQLVRVDRDERLVDVPQIPVWLAGFEGTTNNESLGSLIVNLPDGRNEPLTVGYHKVSVEIRDQIARTTIEESFVNHTLSRLEGVFHFPLPQDASISGFGMWIGNDLIEADVVEKQRAREIYETILREKRDPGLLEWTGGNIFKARVFPIEAQSEKRIKIVYSQVLPLRANRYRYSYGLRSEMLRTKPLRELSLSVTVNSAIPLKSVSCPTHSVRTQLTGHSAQVDFNAQEYTPSRDFEVVCEIDRNQSDVVVIPHRRGDDGYLLVQVTPPSANGNWQRELLPDGKPLKFVLLCDTSASMDSEKRNQQAEFVGAVLSSLGPDDRFQLVCADVGTAWVSAESMAPNAENIAKAKAFLDQRISLGWTDLDRAFSDVLKKAPNDSQVIYIGDGIVSAGNTDPAAFVKRLAQFVSQPNHPTLHSVTVGNTSETIVMKGIATVGRGSSRAISGEQTPRVVALELLNEIAQPGLRNMNVEFRGLKVAAVYPGQLPNVAAGTQHILVGRYLPEGKDQHGEIIVTGERGGEKVKYAARVNFKDAEEGNSFIPRLWARAHLDYLLAQGQSAAIHDEIIRLSEEFHIITPFTSLLVLETDADRERFGVQRRYEMRDGERFFAEGRSNANFELIQAQIKRAGIWRFGLRQQILRSLRGMDRNSLQIQLIVKGLNEFERPVDVVDSMSPEGATPYRTVYSRSSVGRKLPDMSLEFGEAFGAAGAVNKSTPSWSLIDEPMGEVRREEAQRSKSAFLGDEADSKHDEFSNGLGLEAKLAKDQLFDGEMGVDADEDGYGRGEGLFKRSGGDNGRRQLYDRLDTENLDISDFKSIDGRALHPAPGPAAGEPFAFESAPIMRRSVGGKPASAASFFEYERLGRGVPDYTAWMSNLFPALESTPTKPRPSKLPDTWSPEALAISKLLVRTESLMKLDGGIEVRQITDSWIPRTKQKLQRNSEVAIYSPAGWLHRKLNPLEETVINYCTPKQRGVYSQAFLLGRERASADFELKSPPLHLNDWSISPLHESYRDWTARVEPAGENRMTLVILRKESATAHHFLIDTSRNVILKQETFADGKLNSSMNFDEFVELAGQWWATRSTHFDEQGRKTSETILDIQTLTRKQHAQRMDAELVAKPSVQFIQLPFVKLKVARQKVADGSATFDDHLTMILETVRRQQWDDMWKHVDAIEKLAVDKPGIRWLRTILLATIRRNEEARQRIIDEARQMVANPTQEEMFLIGYLFNEVHSLTAWPEFLEFVQLVKPIYERQPAELDVMPNWMERLASCYDALGRTEEMLTVRHSLAERASWNISMQVDYARRLAQAGQFDAAHAWLRKALERPDEKTDDEDESIRTAIADIFRMQARWTDLLAFTTEWIGRKPESMSHASAYAQHLSALVFNDQMDAANGLVEKWLKEARVEGKQSPEQQSKFQAAFNYVLGNAHQIYFQRMDERWIESLAETVRFFVRHPHHSDYAARAMGHHYFNQSDAADRLRGEFLRMLQTDLAKLSPAQISSLIGWTVSGRMEFAVPLNGRKQMDASEVPDEVWKQIASKLKLRWEETQDKNDKHSLGSSLHTIYSLRFRETELLPFLRQQVATASADFKQSYISALFEALLSTPWSDDLEQEAFARLRDLSAEPELIDRLNVQLPALYRLVDAMLANRQAAAEKTLTDQGGQDKFTRKELAEKKAQLREEALKGLAERLTSEASKEDGPLSVWLAFDKYWLKIQLNQDLKDVEEFCWKILGESPPRVAEPTGDEEEANPIADEQLAKAATEFKSQYIESLLKQRAFGTVMKLATRKKAEPPGIERLLKFIDAGIALGGDAGATWRMTKFRMLVALDRSDELERALREWIRTDVSTAPWRNMLGRLVAERGRFDEAIQLFEACEKDKLLGAGDYQMLADWYLVVNRRDAYERSRIEAYKQLAEGNLAQMIYQMRNRWVQQSSSPAELDENSLFVFKALFEKSASPENYFWQLREIYAATRDFRLMQMLPDAMLGRSPQQVYSFLSHLNSLVLYELRNEATADEVLNRAKTLRGGERTATDLRALDLLEALVERKSSETLNQPGPHVDACLAAMRRAFERKWGDGEPRLMATFLYQLGGLSQEKLRDEQLRELVALQKMVPAPGRDHLFITSDLCNLIGWNYSRFGDALREMESVVRAYDQMHDGIWPNADNQVLASYVSLYEGANRHAAGEEVLLKYIRKPEHIEQKKWLRDRLMSLYNHALEHNGAVSLGTGRDKLFDPIFNLALKQIDDSIDENDRHNLIARLGTTFDIANRHQMASAKTAIRKFAFEVMPVVLKRQTTQYRNTVTTPIYVITQIAGSPTALRYIVERMEQYPQRLDFTWENSWQALGYELAARRHESGSTELDARVLTLSIRELQRELRTGDIRNQSIYHRSYPYFWQEKANDFAKAAEVVLTENKSSGRRTMAVANYLYHGLGLMDRAIEVLLIAHKNGLLEESSQTQLVQWLHASSRHAESIPILEPLVVSAPDNMRYRVLLMTAYFQAKRPEQFADALQLTHDHFHAGGRWNEGNASQLARACFDCGQPGRAVTYFTEVIALHQRVNPGGGLNDATLANYYNVLAEAHSQLGQTKPAVDAASAAIVCWGMRHDQRAYHVATLQRILTAAKDLDDYVHSLDQESARTGQDSPILRKNVGSAYQGRGDMAKAIAQFKLAIDIQPNDAETHQALITCYDALQDAPAATRQLLQLIDLRRHDLSLYQQLANRLKDDEEEAERAATSIIEAAPNEAENHAAMAELRQTQDRWDEAIPHWERVAELRRLEPNGLVKLAEAQLHQKQWKEAKTTIARLRKTEWPSRFGDIQQQARQLESRLP